MRYRFYANAEIEAEDLNHALKRIGSYYMLISEKGKFVKSPFENGELSLKPAKNRDETNRVYWEKI